MNTQNTQTCLVLYFAYSIFRSIDISTLSIQCIFLGILNFLSSRNNGFCMKYPIQKCVQLCSTVSIGTTYSKHVYQHVYQHMCISTCVSAYVYQHIPPHKWVIPPHKRVTCSNKTSIGKLTSDSPLLTIVDIEWKKEGTPGVQKAVNFISLVTLFWNFLRLTPLDLTLKIV